MSFQATDIDLQAIRETRALAADMVETAKNGHPGTPISLAPAAYLLYQYVMKTDPSNPNWLGRDRFVLSAGHASALQYIQLYLAGFGIKLEDLKKFRQNGSLLTGHPEYGVQPGVEITTGPLGTGVAAAVGMAMEQRRLRGMLDPDSPVGKSPFDHYVYVISGDGCIQEGISYEACSLAGTQELGNLIYIYDENRISIEDDTTIAFNENIRTRFESQGWDYHEVDWLQTDGTYEENLSALFDALESAKRETLKPSLIKLRTIIGWPSPRKQNRGEIHGAPLGTGELEGLKQALGLNPRETFTISPEVLEYTRANAAKRAQEARDTWQKQFTQWQTSHPQAWKLLQRLQAGKLAENIEQALPRFEAGKALSTRAASGTVINALAKVMPELWGGSADLAGSNNTEMKDELSFAPLDKATKAWKVSPYGRNLHFGVREHGMAGILNGIASSGLTLPYGGTFFVFSDFMRGAVRLSALMGLPVTFVWTHDSIGVGEDGPTHQPVETLAAFRAMPGFAVVRPADADETAWAWLEILRRRRPAALVLSRQALPNPGREHAGLAPANKISYGGYVLKDWGANPQVILLATGSEVSLALEAGEKLAAQDIISRVVNLPCVEWFEAQSLTYRNSVIPPAIKARVSVEAGVAQPWYKYLGDAGLPISIESFGQPNTGTENFRRFGFTVDNIVAKAKESLRQATAPDGRAPISPKVQQ